MTAQINDASEPLGRLQVIPDFLPSPDELAFREEGVKVILALGRKGIDFFKSDATKHQTHCPRMTCRHMDAYVGDAYVDAQSQTRRSSGRAVKRRAAQPGR